MLDFELTMRFKTLSITTALAITMLTTGSVSAFRISGQLANGPTGNDVSWPQCGQPLPTGQSFGIVGVNDGLANNTNPCFGTEFTWASGSSGQTSQAKTQVYVNTGNPGSFKPTVADWPTSDTDVVTGAQDVNPNGPCAGGNTLPCAWQYGYNEANLDASSRGVTNPNALTWWLDVETANSWTNNAKNNQADLVGMTTFFESLGAKVGIYSTASQWRTLMGNVSATSTLNGLPSWLPGAKTLAAAQSNCSLSPLTNHGIVSLTQYTSNGTDYDVSCH